MSANQMELHPCEGAKTKQAGMGEGGIAQRDAQGGKQQEVFAESPPALPQKHRFVDGCGHQKVGGHLQLSRNHKRQKNLVRPGSL